MRAERTEGNQTEFKQPDQFAAKFYMVHKWYHLVIRQLVDSIDFVANGEWISRRLRGKVRPQQAMESLLHLEVTGLICRDPITGRYQVVHDKIESDHDVPSDILRTHHSEMMLRARESLYSDSVHHRQFNSLTISIAPERLSEAKTVILNFLRSFNDEFSDEGLKRHIFQLNTQLFEHTDSAGEL